MPGPLAEAAVAPPREVTRRRWRAGPFLLVLPLLLFLLAVLILPLATMLVRGVADPDFAATFPRTAMELGRWDGKGMPPPEVAAAFVTEIRAARGTDGLARAAGRLNAESNGFRSLVMRTARNPPSPEGDVLAALARLDARWGDRANWAAMRRSAGPWTAGFLLTALDLRLDDEGAVREAAPEARVFRNVLLRTLWVGVVVTLGCLVLGYPVAYLIANMGGQLANILLLLVLIPFWTSVLVRSAAWVVLLQQNGLINAMLQRVGLIEAPLAMIYNRTGVYIAMIHVLLPLMVLPLYSVMKGIGPAPMKAAMSLGARPFTAFRRVYLPQTKAGIMAGCLLVYISALGYYVTPELVGGAGDQLISYFIAFYTNRTLNWGMAAALSIVLLLATGLLYALYAVVDARKERVAR